MQNAAVAQVFQEIADWMEVAGENVFKIRAYRRAAEAVAVYPEPIEDASESGALEKIEGLGAATVAKTREFLATGRVQELEKLRAAYPPGLLELMRVPGLGPKRIAQLYQERGINSIETLQNAITGEELKGLAGFGPKTIQNIQNGLTRLSETTSQMPLFEALRVSSNLTALMARADGVLDVTVAGDVRRGCETTERLQLVAQADDVQAAAQIFSRLPLVQKVVEHTDSVVRVCVHPGVEAELITANRGSFGAVLLRSTGSETHWRIAQQRAAQRGLDLREDGLFKDGEPIAAPTEADIYATLGVPFIAAELREGQGEWEAAERGELPALVQMSDIRGDLHAHSTWSDGTASIRQMVAAAREHGYEYHAVTDHSKALAMTNGLDARRLREQGKEIAEVQAEFPDVKILRGIECDILRDGTLDLDDDILHELDIVIASVHSAFKLEEAAQTERMIRAIAHPAVDLVAHPTGRIVGGRPGYNVNIEAIIEAAHETGTALEINASERLDMRDTHAKLARDKGVLICIDTDAHSTRMLNNLKLGILTARRAWCRPQDVINTRNTAELIAWLHRPQSQA
ncbi:MAG TPA: DNA polymerase/3'-5' exonuclease PolX [Abditibacteriaceae bacterium]|jgi:DNA polymerase (family 10)